MLGQPSLHTVSDSRHGDTRVRALLQVAHDGGINQVSAPLVQGHTVLKRRASGTRRRLPAQARLPQLYTMTTSSAASSTSQLALQCMTTVHQPGVP